MNLQMLADAIFPPQCLTCEELVELPGKLCPACWPRTEFIVDTPCDKCGCPLKGDARDGDLCDDCIETPRLWDKGRAAMMYGDMARKMVLRLKYRRRLEYAIHSAPWMLERVESFINDDTLVIPVPLHWTRMVRRGFNQSAELASEIAHLRNLECLSFGLHRRKRTRCLDGQGPDQRRATLHRAIEATPRQARHIKGREVLLVDDVLTTGATFDACTKACLAAGAVKVNVVAMARVARRM